jgi:hypothetical protein
MTTTTLITMLLMISTMAPGQSAVDWTVYLRRVGPLRIGMPLSEVRRVLRDPQAFLAWTDKEPDDSECAYLQSSRIPKSLGFMFQKGSLVRIDIRERGVRTASGAEVGDTEDRIKQMYPGRTVVEPHHYLPENGHYINYIPMDAVDSNYGVVFETENSRVTSFRIGTRAAIALVEGCS